MCTLVISGLPFTYIFVEMPIKPAYTWMFSARPFSTVVTYTEVKPEDQRLLQPLTQHWDSKVPQIPNTQVLAIIIVRTIKVATFSLRYGGKKT